jgi:hypothetical protein
VPETLLIKPWADPVADTVGHDPRSRYVETFWLPCLGPTAVLLLRHLATRFDLEPAGVELPLADTSMALGLGERTGNSSPIVRTLRRLEQFDLSCSDPYTPTVAVRRNLPPVNRRHVRRLPAHLQVLHDDWSRTTSTDALAVARRRARCLALTLLEQGDDADHVEHTLFSTGFHPAVCHDAARWAHQRHLDAAREAAREAAAPGRAG